MKYIFDKESGTLKPAPIQEKSIQTVPAPKADDKGEEVKMDLTSQKPNVKLNERTISFNEMSDLTIFQVTEERTKKLMMTISGYGLEIKFNIAELRSMERIEQLLNGLNTMFRQIVLEQALGK